MSANSKKEQFAGLTMPLDDKPIPPRELSALEKRRLQKQQAEGDGAALSESTDGTEPPAPAAATGASAETSAAAPPPAPQPRPAKKDAADQDGRIKQRQRKKLQSIESGSMVKTTLEFDEKVYSALKRACFDSRRTMVDLTEEAIKLLLKKMGYKVE